MPELIQTHTYIHARTCTHKYVYTNTARYCIVHCGLQRFGPVWALKKIFTTWYYDEWKIKSTFKKLWKVFWAEINYGWVGMLCQHSLIVLSDHTSVFIEMLAHTKALLHTLTHRRCIRMMITPVLCICRAPMINETTRWKGEGRGFLLRYRKWSQSIWGERHAALLKM